MRKIVDRLLAAPFAYKTYQSLIGAPGCHARFMLEMVSPRVGERVLDVGCGVGASVRFLPDAVTYVGVDMSAAYIDVARTTYGQRGTFVCADITTLDATKLGTFDRAFSFGVMHHLSDEEVVRTVHLIKRVVLPGGTFSTLDPCYVAGQSPFAKFLIDNDRGKHVRDRPGFERLLSGLGKVRSRVFHDLLTVPYTQLAMQVIISGSDEA